MISRPSCSTGRCRSRRRCRATGPPTAPSSSGAGRRRSSRAPLRIPFRTWWKKIGCVSRAFDPHSTMRSVFSISSYELVPPPAPNTVARPTTEGACQVRLQLSMLLLRRTVRMNFCATKFISLVAFEQLNMPTPSPAFRSVAARRPAAARSSASSQVAVRRPPFVADHRLGEPCEPVLHRGVLLSLGSEHDSMPSPGASARSGGDALGVAVDVRASVADEPDQRHPEPLGGRDREARRAPRPR